ncbi:uncharacterized protein I303_107316 [Kwoniella dejecticola CBS 10117]|uniref:Uncharacterized protein n=1 Tax=Kwoniella dejecticola CBS 10117 TaxID=1296121 RepID=A0A1A5ZZC2_9TREE|nr:uncharacterized protein I303_06720 [Kwoniella dejecticola CBS 10117]OBR83161.1 hypothetical protein I303_06720 [Kwoniella dejecticola CBS 10117]
MDDPWAGPSWSTPSKPSSSVAMTMTMPDPGRTTPPPRFDDSDPWGKAHPPQLPSSSNMASETTEDEEEEVGRNEVAERPGWGEDVRGAWAPNQVEEGAAAASSPSVASPKVDQGVDSSDWERTISPQKDTRSQSASPDKRIASPTITASPPIRSSPSSPSIPKFADESFESATSALTSLPKSPSFGDDFGGFSAGPSFSSSSAGPWVNKASNDVGGSTVKVDSERWGGEDLSWGAPKDELPSWGGDKSFEEEEEEQEISFRSPVLPQMEDDEEDQPDEDAGWGRSRSRPSIPVVERPKGEDDWEEAQRKLQVKQERAPQEKIDGLAKAWTDLLGGLIQIDLEKMTGAEELQFEEKVKQLDDETLEHLRKMSNIPPDINTYPPVITSLVTHERYTYALQRPNPSPSTSLLTSTIPRRPTKVDPLSFSDGSGPSWTSRSMLGEPDAPLQGSSQQTQEDAGNKSRWSFWGRRPVPERQLTTSGGGMLERKSISVSSPDHNNERTSAEMRASTSSKPSSRAPSVIMQPSRPASPAPPSVSQPNIPTTSHEDGHASPSTSLPQAPSQPSAVSRFFGRLSRNKSSSPATQEDEHDKDLQLSADDFSFLSEVPSLSSPPPEKGVGDLLALEPGRNEQIASLESMLNTKITPLPKPLAPPPKSSAPMGNRSSSGKFIARMKSPQPTNFDLLGDLNFSGPTDTSVPSSSLHSPIAQSPQNVSSPSNAWDDFLSLDAGPSQPVKTNIAPQVKSPATPMIAPPLVPSRSNTPTVSLSPPPPQPIQTQAFSTPRPSIAQSSSAIPAKNASGDLNFDDFGTPQHASTSTFDDFGDFSAFDSAPAPPQSQPQPPASMHSQVQAQAPHNREFNMQTPNKAQAIATPNQKQNLSTPVNHNRPGSLDHTPTLQLMNGASASKGKRWPAPPSPVAPVLAPPPKPPQTQTGAGAFPFLSPPPPGRPSSRSSNLLDDSNGDSGLSPGNTYHGQVGIGIDTVDTAGQTNAIFGGALQPSRSTTPSQLGRTVIAQPASQAQAVKPIPTSAPTQAQTVQGKGGLSAQDLSFFDSL